MRKKLFILLLVSIFSLPYCSPPENSNYKGIISVSILPQKYFVEEIAGPEYKINVLIPPGASPASYEPSPKQIEEVSQSDLYFRIGKISFEKAWINNLQRNNPSVPFIDLSEGMDFITSTEDHGDHRHEGEDPHIWMSPENVLSLSKKIFNHLVEIYPDDSILFQTNFKDFVAEIEEVKSHYQNNLNELEGKHFLIYHPALGYLARDYGMIQHVLEFEGKEPPPSHIAEIIKEAKENDIGYIFIQSQFNMDNAKSLANEIGADIILIDPLNENWKEEMLSILEKLKNKPE